MSITTTKQANVMTSIDAMLQSVDSQMKTAEANTEAGGYDGATEHPVKKEDDRTEDAYTGSRSSENEEDIKEEQSPNEVDGKDVNKESATKAALGLGSAVNQDDVQLNIGTKQRATGEDSASETAKAKGGKDDSDDGDGGSQNRGKSTHPARTNNEEIDGHKWSNDIHALLGSIKTAQDSGNSCVAAIAIEADDSVKTKIASMGKQSGSCDKCSNDPCDCDDGKYVAEKAGADLASAVMGDVGDSDIQAQSAQVVGDLFETIKVAYIAADMTADLLAGVREAGLSAEKTAMHGEEEVPGEERPPGEEEGGGGEAPPEEMGGGGGEDPMMGGGEGGEEELMAALSAEGGGEGGDMGMGGGGGMPGEDPMGGGPPMGEEMGGGMPMPEMGGAPPMGGDPMGGDPMGGDPMGGDPMGGDPMGGDPMGGEMGGEMGGDGIGQEELAMLAQALQEAGITPQQLEAAAAGKMASALKVAQAKGIVPEKWYPRTQKEAARYQKVLNYVNEVTGS